MASDHDLINQLLARAGAIMEDASVPAIVDDGTRTIAERIAILRKAGRAISALTDAAATIITHQAS